MSGGPYELRPAYASEDYSIVVTVDGTASIAAWTLSFQVWNPDGTAINSGLSVSVTDANARQITALATGLNLARGVYRWSIRRTDSGARHVVAWGTLVIADETNE